jgi:hypothetical protein
MAFHVPFNQRPSGQQPLPGPIYIGFDAPAAGPRRKFNWWGFNGMWMSFASLLTAGFLSPISLLVSLKGLRRPGKKMATVGTLISLAGTALASVIGIAAYNGHQTFQAERLARKQATVIKAQVEDVKQTVAVAVTELQEFQADNAGQFPGDVDGNLLVIKYVDPWGESLRFDLEENAATVRSAGPDKKFYTRDDVSKEIKGKSDSGVPVK